jgi:hypothetical protein
VNVDDLRLFDRTDTRDFQTHNDVFGPPYELVSGTPSQEEIE